MPLAPSQGVRFTRPEAGQLKRMGQLNAPSTAPPHLPSPCAALKLLTWPSSSLHRCLHHSASAALLLPAMPLPMPPPMPLELLRREAGAQGSASGLTLRGAVAAVATVAAVAAAACAASLCRWSSLWKRERSEIVAPESGEREEEGEGKEG